jgi:hypothetical protein
MENVSQAERKLGRIRFFSQVHKFMYDRAKQAADGEVKDNKMFNVVTQGRTPIAALANSRAAGLAPKPKAQNLNQVSSLPP